MKKISNLFVLFILLVAQTVYGQSIDLNLEDQKSCEDNSYCVTLQLKGTTGSDAFEIGTSSMLLSYDPNVISFRNYTPLQFNNTSCSPSGWASHQIDGISLPGKLDLTLTLENNNNSCPSIGDVSFVDIGTVCFDILQEGAIPNISFDLNHTHFNRNLPDNGTNSIVVANASTLDLEGVLLCNCLGAGNSCDDNNVYTVNDQFDTYCDCKGTYQDTDLDGIFDGVDACLDQVYQAEDAAIGGGASAKTNQAQYTGTGFVDYKNKTNDYVEFTVQTNFTGNHNFDFRYALATGNRPLELQIDGVVIIESLDFPATGSWTTWNIVSTTQALTAGTHTIRLRTKGQNGGNLDQLLLSYCTDCTQSGQTCDDGDPCTIDDVYDVNCNCHGKYEDTDKDGICNPADICEGFDDTMDNDSDMIPDGCDTCDNTLIGTACDDGNPCTSNDMIGADCNCAGTFSGNDADNDGVCDTYDLCAGGDDSEDTDNDGIPDFCDSCDETTLGSPCDDGDPCTILDAIRPGCACVGIFIDSDGDGTCNSLDICEGHDDTVDSDNDTIPDGCDDCDNNLEGTSCNDGNNCTINDVYDSNCNCIGTFADADADGVCDARDLCEGFDDNADVDADAIPDDCDTCNDEVYQAEDAYFSGALFKNYGYGYAGTGFVDYKNASGDSLQFTIDIETAGAYWVAFRYARKSGNPKLELQVDGAIIHSALLFPKTGNNNIWKTVGLYQEFEIGTHTIQLTSNGTNGPNVDYLSLCYEVLDPITVTTNTSDVLCYGDNIGSATATVIGGTNTFSYLWSNGETSSNTNNLTAGDYTLTVTDALGYSEFTSITISEPPALSLSADVTNSSDSDGVIDITVGGGVAPYTYSWSSGGATTEDLDNLKAGRYKVIVTDANACKLQEFISVYPTDMCLENIYQAEDAQVSGPTLKTSNFGFTGSGYADFINATGDNLTFTIDITEAGAHYLDFRYALKNGNRPLSIHIDGIEKFASFAFPKTGAWNKWKSVGFYHEFEIGSHTVLLTSIGSNGGNIDYLSVCHEVLNPITLTTTTSDVLCNEGSDGSASLTAVGGTNSFDYLWSTGETSSTVNELSAGDYTVTATDALGYTASTSITIHEPLALSTDAAVTNSSGSDGAIDITVNGGTAPFAYNWQNGSATTEDHNNLAAGRYKVVVTDDHACTLQEFISVYPSDMCIDNVYQAEDAQITGAIVKSQHFGFTEGGYVDFINSTGDNLTFTIDITEIGVHYLDFRYASKSGNRPLSIEIDGVEEYASFKFPKTGAWNQWTSIGFYHDFATTGNHTISLSTIGANGANFDFLSVCHEVLAPIAVTIDPTDASCNGGTDGAAVATAIGGTGVYTYQWSSGSTSDDIDGVSAGTYTVTISDYLGNTGLGSVTIGEPTAISLTTTAVDVSCFGGNDGTASVTAIGGTGDITFVWSNGNDGATANGLSQDNYTVVASDANGCTATAMVTISQPSELAIAHNTIPDFDSDGAIDITASGGTGAYTYSWSNGETSEDIEGLSAGDYDVVLTDANACSISKTITVHSTPTMESGTIDAVSDVWQTVTLDNTYNSMVVVATVVMPDANVLSVTTRVKNASGSSFDLKVQNPNDAAIGDYDVHYFVVEEGTYTTENHGITMEAQKILSTSTSKKNAWVLDAQTYENSYLNPVVVGQVMTANDADWSVFWASKHNSQFHPPHKNGFSVGKHVGEDSDATRADETIGYIVLETGTYSLNGFDFQTGVGNDKVRGLDDTNSGYSYTLTLGDISRAVVSSAAMDGGDGGWPTLFGSNAIFEDKLKLVIDEDQIGDNERAHTHEQVAYLAFDFSNTPTANKTASEQNVRDTGTWESIHLFPNPVSHTLFVESKLEAKQAVELQLLDMSGRTLLRQQMISDATGWIKSNLDVSELTEGVYMIYLRSAEKTSVAKFIKGQRK